MREVALEKGVTGVTLALSLEEASGRVVVVMAMVEVVMAMAAVAMAMVVAMAAACGWLSCG